jgi:hypothetical protein
LFLELKECLSSILSRVQPDDEVIAITFERERLDDLPNTTDVFTVVCTLMTEGGYYSFVNVVIWCVHCFGRRDQVWTDCIRYWSEPDLRTELGKVNGELLFSDFPVLML